MPALIQDRNTPKLLGDTRTGQVAAATRIHAGAYLMRNAAGFLVEGQVAAGLIGVGRAQGAVDNSAGTAGALEVRYSPGIFRYENFAADVITQAAIGSLAYAVDDQTVARTHAVNTRSPAGVVEDVDAQGVWVRFDEALARSLP